jgi:type IV pilus assembly protein PilM
MFGFIMGSRPSPIALDIGAGGIRMIQLKKIGGRLFALASGRWRFPQAMASWKCADPAGRRASAVAAVRALVKAGGFRGTHVVSSISTSLLSIKNVRLPHMGDSELAKAVLWEAKERFGFEVSRDQISYINAGPVRQGSETRDEIIMVAIPPKIIEDHMAMIDEMGLKPDHIDAEPIAMFRSFERFLRRTEDEQRVSVVIDIGLNGTSLVVARGRQILFIKSIDIGGRRLNEAIASQLNLSYDEACELRSRSITESEMNRRLPKQADAAGKGNGACVDPSSVNWTIHDALRAEMEGLAKEVALCLRYCSVTFRGLRCDHVAVVGGEAYDPVVIQLLSEHLGIECSVGQPLRGVDTSNVDVGKDRRGMLAEWSTCAGLAVRDLELPSVQQSEGDLDQPAHPPRALSA